MQIDRIYYPIKTLGPGNRIGIWTIGCNHRCLNCSNPELWGSNPEKEISINSVFTLLESVQINYPELSGVTISGGEPFQQSDELLELVQYIRNNITDDILIYSGFSIEELKIKKNRSIQIILNNIAVLIDGLYVEELNDNRALRGSSNQTVHILNSKYLESYCKLQNSVRNVQNVYYENKMISFGIPMQDYRESMSVGLENKGVLTGERYIAKVAS